MTLAIALTLTGLAATTNPPFFQTLENLPPELARFEARIAASARRLIEITPRPGPTRLWQSKYRGHPYLPKGKEYPRNVRGRPMPLLAQINLREAPRLEELPESGLLQFFISDGMDGEHVWGLRSPKSPDVAEEIRLNTTPDFFEVRYYPEVVEDEDAVVTSFGYLPTFDHLPVVQEHRLSFVARTEYVPTSDLRFERILGTSFFDRFGARAFVVAEHYDERFHSEGNKLGGYASFVQQDPRGMFSSPGAWVLLLQIDEVEGADIIWGDGGVANFFIERDALKRRDFSRVLYNWDNH